MTKEEQYEEICKIVQQKVDISVVVGASTKVEREGEPWDMGRTPEVWLKAADLDPSKPNPLQVIEGGIQIGGLGVSGERLEELLQGVVSSLELGSSRSSRV